MAWSRLGGLVAAWVAVGGIALAPPGCTGQMSAPDGGTASARQVPTVQTGTGPGPAVTGLDVGPPDASGTVILQLAVSGARGGALAVSAAVSRGNGAVTTATIDAPLPTGDGSNVTVPWHALDDIGFRPDPSVVLTLIVSDRLGPGPAARASLPPFSNRHAAARRVDHHLVNYGPWTDEDVATALLHDLVIAHPGQASLTRARVAALQQGVDPLDPSDDVLVLCYISVGEDLRTIHMTDDQIRADPRFRGDGSGPRIDPRGVAADGKALDGIDPRGLPSTGGTGFASYYLDDNDVHDSADHVGDGFPDRNKIFAGLFVNAGDPAWFPVIDAMTLDSPDKLAGFRELLTPDYGRGLDCDGVFLDTIDTAAPNSYTDAGSANQSEFEWTAPGFGTFIRAVHDAYPDRIVLQNRGLFFFDPRRPQFRFNARGAIDFVLFESFRLNSNAADDIDPDHYPDNRYNFAPKLMAEANRPDGFKVLSLGYAEGPADQMSHDTLLGTSMLGLDSLLEDIHVTQELQGFRHYLTNGAVNLVNDFVLTHADLTDHDAPTWTSTWNDHAVSPAVAATPRIGIQQAVAAPGGAITVRWDVALDESGTSYVLYAQPAPFEFATDPTLSYSRRVPLVPSLPSGYAAGVGPGRFPYEATVGGFPAGQTQYLLIRAVDHAAPPNMDANQVVLTAAPGS